MSATTELAAPSRLLGEVAEPGHIDIDGNYRRTFRGEVGGRLPPDP
jgi:hypothetical protein